MSKSKGNIVDPLDLRRPLRRRRGAARTRSSWARPTRTWSGRTPGVEGVWRFLQQALARRAASRRRSRRGRRSRSAPLRAKAHETIAKVTDDIDRRFAFNTPIAARDGARERDRSAPRTIRRARFAAETAVSLIQPYAPHVAEELWERARRASGCGRRRGLRPIQSLLERDTVEVVVPGERQAAATVCRCRRRSARRSSSRARAGVRAGAGAPERRRASEDDWSSRELVNFVV